MPNLIVDYNRIGHPVPGRMFRRAVLKPERAGIRKGVLVRILGDSVDEHQAIVTRLSADKREVDLTFV